MGAFNVHSLGSAISAALLVCCLLSPRTSEAISAIPELVPAYQPDGSQVLLRLVGDNRNSYLTDSAGFLVLPISTARPAASPLSTSSGDSQQALQQGPITTSDDDVVTYVYATAPGTQGTVGPVLLPTTWEVGKTDTDKVQQLLVQPRQLVSPGLDTAGVCHSMTCGMHVHPCTGQVRRLAWLGTNEVQTTREKNALLTKPAVMAWWTVQVLGRGVATAEGSRVASPTMHRLRPSGRP
jgi:hypothetical protein